MRIFEIARRICKSVVSAPEEALRRKEEGAERAESSAAGGSTV